LHVNSYNDVDKHSSREENWRAKKISPLENSLCKHYLKARIFGDVSKKTRIADFKKINKMRTKLIFSLDNRNYGHVQETAIPKAAWNKLIEIFENRGLMRKVSQIKMQDLGKPQKFLGMQIEGKSQNEISIYQRSYIEHMLEKFKMTDFCPTKMPMKPNAKMELSLKKVTPNESEMENVPYLEAVGSLLYIS